MTLDSHRDTRSPADRDSTYSFIDVDGSQDHAASMTNELEAYDSSIHLIEHNSQMSKNISKSTTGNRSNASYQHVPSYDNDEVPEIENFDNDRKAYSSVKIDEKNEYDQWGSDDEFYKDESKSEDDIDIMINSVVPTTDDPTQTALSFRSFILGTFWCSFLAAANALFMFRTNELVISSTIANLLSFPAGKFLERTLPYKRIKIGKWIDFSLNPGPFNMKEHAIIAVMSSAGAAGAYGIDNVVVQKSELFMGNTAITIGQSLGWIFASQFIGFGLAGVMRRFVIWPKHMIWPSNLSHIALFVSFHKQFDDQDNGRTWKISRMKFFWISFILIFIYTWIPEFFAVTLQTVSVLCFVAGGNKTLRFLGSSDNKGGLGLGALTFDWNMIKFSPLTTPFWAIVNTIGGNMLLGWVLTPIFFYSNIFGKDQTLKGPVNAFNETLPVLNSVSLFSDQGNPISAVDLYNSTTFDLNTEAYSNWGPIRITTLFAVSYMASFITSSSSVSHVFIWHGKDIVRQFKQFISHKNHEEDDIHNRLMRSYPEVPEFVYLGMLLIFMVIMVLVCTYSPFVMPVWAVFLAVSVAFVLLLPIAVIAAISGTQLYLNVITEFLIGLIIPGKTIAVMAFKSLGTNANLQAMSLLADLKLGHYMHIPPRQMLAAQLYGTFIGTLTATFVTFWVMQSFTTILGKGDWKALQYLTFHSAGAIWGAIGPQRFFGIGSTYQATLLGFPLGFGLPLIPYFLNKVYPSPTWKLVNVPLIASFTTPGSLQNSYIMPLIIGFIFQKYLFTHAQDWWKKYNYVLSVALASGASVAVLLIAITTNLGYRAPYWALNPNVNEVPYDYYCQGYSWHK